MKNLLFFLWVMFAPLVEDIANWVVYKTKGRNLEDSDQKSYEGLFFFIFYGLIAYLLYEGK